MVPYKDSSTSKRIGPASGPILAVQVAQGFAGLSCDGGAGWVFPSSAAAAYSQAPPVAPKRDGLSWASNPQAWGAVMADSAQVLINAYGRTQQPVLLTGIKARVLQRHPELKGTVVNILMPGGCAPVTFQIGTIDLDKSPPAWVSPAHSSGITAGDRTAQLKFPYTVSSSDPEAFVVTVFTQYCDCTWDLELDWVSGNKFGKSVIDDQGRPFETTGVAHLPWIGWIMPDDPTSTEGWTAMRLKHSPY
jgi:hypothetical protein